MNTVKYRLCQLTDVADCYQLECLSYPPDEAATLSSLQYRQKYASPYFLCAFIDSLSTTASQDTTVISSSSLHKSTLIGFICSTKCHQFTHDTMSTHVQDGSMLAIHSVVIHPQYRRQQYGTQMLQYYIKNIAMRNNSIHDHERVTKIALLAKAHLLSFYVNSGFQVLRPSAITHGKEKWYDLELSLTNDTIPLAKTTLSHHGEQKGAGGDAGYEYFVVDAFANPNIKGTGNPAAVVPLNQEPTDVRWMQIVAQEMNLSETAFVWKKSSTVSDTYTNDTKNDELINHYGIRYFTPTIEVDLCGHATLASAAIVCSTNRTNDVVFHANHNVLLIAALTTQGEGCNNNSSNNKKCTQISMTFPTQPITEIISSSTNNNNNDYDDIIRMITTAFPTITNTTKDILFIGYVDGLGDLLIEVTYDAFIFDTTTQEMNIGALLEWNGYTRGAIICCVGPKHTDTTTTIKQRINIECDFISRFFAPKAGIDEDPVTGSAHCALALYFGQKLHQTTLIGQQKSTRGGIVHCELSEDKLSVIVTGTAATIAKGTFWM